MTGKTLTETIHGNPGEKRILPAGLKVELRLATNLPVDSSIKFWASPISGHTWPLKTATWAATVGVGLSFADVSIDLDDYALVCCQAVNDGLIESICQELGNDQNSDFTRPEVVAITAKIMLFLPPDTQPKFLDLLWNKV